MNGRRVASTSIIVAICNVLLKPARKYVGQILFGALMRPGIISSQLRGHAEGLVKRIYEQLAQIFNCLSLSRCLLAFPLAVDRQSLWGVSWS